MPNTEYKNNYAARFIKPLVVTPLEDGKNWDLTDSLMYMDSRGSIHHVQKGFRTDFASIPSISKLGGGISLVGWLCLLLSFWYLPHVLRVVGSVLMLLGISLDWIADSFNNNDRLDAPATLHDNGYRRKRLGNTSWVLKFYWDWLLYDALRTNKVPFWLRSLIWLNVTLFGWHAWNEDGKLS